MFANALGAQSAHAEILEVLVVLEPVLRSLAAVARCLHAAESCHLGSNYAFVDADGPGLERLRDPPDAPDAARIEVRRESARRLVGERNRFALGLEPEQGRDRPERFFRRETHRGVGLAKHGGLVEIAAKPVALAACEEPRAAPERIVDVLLHLDPGPVVDQRALIGGTAPRRA